MPSPPSSSRAMMNPASLAAAAVTIAIFLSGNFAATKARFVSASKKHEFSLFDSVKAADDALSEPSSLLPYQFLSTSTLTSSIPPTSDASSSKGICYKCYLAPTTHSKYWPTSPCRSPVNSVSSTRSDLSSFAITVFPSAKIVNSTSRLPMFHRIPMPRPEIGYRAGGRRSRTSIKERSIRILAEAASEMRRSPTPGRSLPEFSSSCNCESAEYSHGAEPDKDAETSSLVAA
jgi:hypothetical protein